jgi:hypothetical protein
LRLDGTLPAPQRGDNEFWGSDLDDVQAVGAWVIPGRDLPRPAVRARIACAKESPGMVSVMISSEEDEDVVEAILADASIGATRITRERVTGGTELVTALVTLTPVVLAAVVKILHDKWAADGKVTIEAKGVKLKGMSAADAERILKQLLEKPRAGK